MITEHDLKAAIAEMQGERSPNANTCIKLAAYYIILNELKKDEAPSGVSYAAPPSEEIQYQSDTDFFKAIKDKPLDFTLSLFDELMTVLQAVYPRLYSGVMSKL